MRILFWWLKFLVGLIPYEQYPTIARELCPSIMERIPRSKKSAFLINLCDASLDQALAGISHSERAALMNSLLPLAAREFPLAEINFLAAFPDPTNPYQQG